MASLSVVLCVAGQRFPVRHCWCGVQQATQERGRVSTQVRHEPVQLLLDVPDGDTLLTWAAAPHQQQAASIVFLDADGGVELETLRLQSAYCVKYREEFRQGDEQDGAYTCQLTLADPSGWTWQAGGPQVPDEPAAAASPAQAATPAPTME